MKHDNGFTDYLECAFWSSIDGNDDPMDDAYGADDLTRAARERLLKLHLLSFHDQRYPRPRKTDALITRPHISHP